MGNLLRISQKEFIDLLHSPMVMVIFTGFLIIQVLALININANMQDDINSNYFTTYHKTIGIVFSSQLLVNLIGFYGPIIAIIIGCSSIASERHRNALNTLLTKPLHRDTIINGKILGSLAFLAVIVSCIMLFYTALTLIFFGGMMGPTIEDYVVRLPIVFVFSIMVLAFYLSIAMLISLLVRSQAFALILGTLIIYLSTLMQTVNFANVVANLFPGNEISVNNFIIGLTPNGLPIETPELFDSTYRLSDAFQIVLPDFFKFFIFFVIICVVSYTVFVMRDEA